MMSSIFQNLLPILETLKLHSDVRKINTVNIFENLSVMNLSWYLLNKYVNLPNFQVTEIFLYLSYMCIHIYNLPLTQSPSLFEIQYNL